MTQGVFSQLVQSVLLLLISSSDISQAQYPDGRYASHYATRHTALQNTETVSRVNLKIYYETHCPYSIRFFKEQLAPTLERLASHLDIYMIPYGHARTKLENGQYLFQCQHGDIECYGNKLHTCAIDVIQSNTEAAFFNICMMDGTHDYSTLNTLVSACGQKLNIPTSGIWECMNSERSSHLLWRYGEETRALRPRIVPYVILNGSDQDQSLTTQYLGYSVCRLLKPRPRVCGPVS